MMHNAFSCAAGDNCMMGYMWHMWTPTLIGWLFIILIVYIIYWLFTQNGKGLSIKKETPLDILKKRYAAGEITPKQFERMKKELE